MTSARDGRIGLDEYGHVEAWGLEVGSELWWASGWYDEGSIAGGSHDRLELRNTAEVLCDPGQNRLTRGIPSNDRRALRWRHGRPEQQVSVRRRLDQPDGTKIVSGVDMLRS